MYKSLTTTVYQILAMFFANLNTSTVNCPNIVSLDIFVSLKSIWERFWLQGIAVMNRFGQLYPWSVQLFWEPLMKSDYIMPKALVHMCLSSPPWHELFIVGRPLLDSLQQYAYKGVINRYQANMRYLFVQFRSYPCAHHVATPADIHRIVVISIQWSGGIILAPIVAYSRASI